MPGGCGLASVMLAGCCPRARFSKLYSGGSYRSCPGLIRGLAGFGRLTGSDQRAISMEGAREPCSGVYFYRGRTGTIRSGVVGDLEAQHKPLKVEAENQSGRADLSGNQTSGDYSPIAGGNVSQTVYHAPVQNITARSEDRPRLVLEYKPQKLSNLSRRQAEWVDFVLRNNGTEAFRIEMDSGIQDPFSIRWEPPTNLKAGVEAPIPFDVFSEGTAVWTGSNKESPGKIKILFKSICEAFPSLAAGQAGEIVGRFNDGSLTHGFLATPVPVGKRTFSQFR